MKKAKIKWCLAWHKQLCIWLFEWQMSWHWLPFLLLDVVKQMVKFNWWRRLGKRLLFNDIQSKQETSRTVSGWHVWILLRIPVAQILWDFDFLRGLATGHLDEFSIGRYEKNRESLDLYAAKFESGAMRFWGEKSLRRWNPFKTRIPPLSFYYMEQSTANLNSFKIAQKTAFEAKGRL